jgi:hypothetical protein
MKIPPLPFTVTDWSAVAPTVHPGETGEAIWRTFTIGDLVNFATGEHSSCCRG